MSTLTSDKNNKKKHSMNSCQAFLSATRQDARKNGTWTDRAADCLDNGGDYHLVKSYEGKVLWEGIAHCRWCARVEAINYQASDTAAQRVSA